MKRLLISRLIEIQRDIKKEIILTKNNIELSFREKEGKLEKLRRDLHNVRSHIIDLLESMNPTPPEENIMQVTDAKGNKIDILAFGGDMNHPTIYGAVYSESRAELADSEIEYLEKVYQAQMSEFLRGFEPEYKGDKNDRE